MDSVINYARILQKLPFQGPWYLYHKSQLLLCDVLQPLWNVPVIFEWSLHHSISYIRNKLWSCYQLLPIQKNSFRALVSRTKLISGMIVILFLQKRDDEIIAGKAGTIAHYQALSFSYRAISWDLIWKIRFFIMSWNF